jgi:hypothetical protein
MGFTRLIVEVDEAAHVVVRTGSVDSLVVSSESVVDNGSSTIGLTCEVDDDPAIGSADVVSP